MAYEVTATRKRPQSFETMTGQEFVVSTITHAIEQGRIAHAYLLSGPRGVGKTTTARILAKALNCEHGPTPHPCGECASCKEITAGNSPDVIEIDGASNTSVNDIRSIKDEVMFPPQASRYKIYIIDEVHMLSTSAFNALLKTIEEPPSYIVFIFATTELQKVPATIRSRCQQFHFQLIGLEQIKAKLKEAANDLGVQADDDALFWIARESTGSMRDAYTLFDQVVSFSEGHITLSGIKDKLGIIGTAEMNQLALSLVHGDKKQALLTVNDMLKKGVSIDQCVKDLAGYYRSLMLLSQGITQEDILGTRSDAIDDEVKKAYTNEQLEAAVELLLRLYRDIRYSLNPRYDLELAVMRLGSLPFMVSPTSLVARLESLRQSLTQGKSLPAFAKASSPAALQRRAPVSALPQNPVARQQPASMAAAPQPVAEQPRQSFAPAPRALTMHDLEQVGEAMNDSMLGALLSRGVKNIDYDPSRITLHFQSAMARDKCKAKQEALASAIEQICGFEGTLDLLVDTPVQKETKPMGGDSTIAKIASLFNGTVITKEEHT